MRPRPVNRPGPHPLFTNFSLPTGTPQAGVAWPKVSDIDFKRGTVRVEQVRLVLGHASAVLTLRSYTHPRPGKEDRTRSAMDASLGGLRTGCGP
ncbi:hypothetical protein OG292_11285 [Streptomyces sp. NBC_01511]|uniref:hypothetical protein n=1 Tax=Streptomyces sp. NBC_01511 TaxID=2903889 RepID=UPI0038667D7D